jgi:death-on-curing protein
MSEIIWISEELTLAIHQLQIAEHGGLDGVRDAGLLSSALARPQNVYAYLNPKPDLATIAAAYAFGIAKNHPFIDGNKRTAQVVYRTFLLLNGLNLRAADDDKYSALIGLAEGSLDEAGFSEWIRQNTEPA